MDIHREDDGIYLYPGSYWTFGDPQLKVINAERMQDDLQMDDVGSVNHVEDLQVDDDGSVNRVEEVLMDVEENCLESDPVPSRNISRMSGQIRFDPPFVDFSNPVSSHDSDIKMGGVLNINPNQSVIPGRVYSIPEDLDLNPSPDNRVLLKAQKLSLHPCQEHMTMNIASTLVSHKPESPETKRKSGFLSKVLKRL